MFKLKSVISSLLIALPLAGLTGCASVGTDVTDQPTVGKYQCTSKCSSSNRITNSIMNRLQSDSRLSMLPVQVSTCNRVVTLTGKVYNLDQLNMVLYIASHTPGVDLVRNGIMVRDPFVNH